jgi:choline kinase
MIRQAVVLAAGKGQRIRNGTNGVPKPLLRVAGLSLIKRTILTLARSGVNRVYVVVGYRGGEVREAIEADPEYAQSGISVRFVNNPDFELGNGVSLLKVKEVVRGPFVLSMADHVYEPIVGSLAAKSDLDGFDLVLCADRRVAEVYDFDDATKLRLRRDKIVAIGKDLEECDAIDCGVFAIAPSFLDCLEREFAQRGDCSLSDGVMRAAARSRARIVDIGDAFWQDVDTPGARARAERIVVHELVAGQFVRPARRAAGPALT